MWKEILTMEDMEEVVLLRNTFGCTQDFSVSNINQHIRRRKDCHYYHYKSEKIELIKGFTLVDNTQMLTDIGDYIFILAFTIKAEIEDYPEAIRLMGEKSKEYLSTRSIKKLVVGFGSEDETQVNFYNKGVQKIGLNEVVKIVKEEYEKLGFTVVYGDKYISVEL